MSTSSGNRPPKYYAINNFTHIADKSIKNNEHLSKDIYVQKFNAFGASDSCYEYIGTVVGKTRDGKRYRQLLVGDNISTISHVRRVNGGRTAIDYYAEYIDDKDYIYTVKRLGKDVSNK